jgi:hypothetical protein
MFGVFMAYWNLLHPVKSLRPKLGCNAFGAYYLVTKPPIIFFSQNVLKVNFMHKSCCGFLYGGILTINVPLFKKLRDIIFFGGTITL